ncbi:hypothetical protein [Chryseobacterium pennipullorum]|uniref:Lipoprotein n=1 Tax=Chryseobacterium pennipullorum TaxID=2258963 RepID=A0A3D9B5F1_9FLAO|nr:hypothetical protein [Chryseobacterium pennipullorum]REC48890.1 hypothetical protein DRF67_04855 [Chryseobacterium pennipullorum]
MKARLLLSGILLLSIVTACSDRNDEVTAPGDQNKSVELGVKRSESARAINDSLKKTVILDEANNKQGDTGAASSTDQETIDPTKPDRPK